MLCVYVVVEVKGGSTVGHDRTIAVTDDASGVIGQHILDHWCERYVA